MSVAKRTVSQSILLERRRRLDYQSKSQHMDKADSAAEGRSYAKRRQIVLEAGGIKCEREPRRSVTLPLFVSA